MTNAINVADLVNPDSGLTYRQENAKLQHNIPVGALVEVLYENPDAEQNICGLRLFVAEHLRDCDQTPLYSLTALSPYRFALLKSVYGESKGVFRDHFIVGWAEDNLKVIRLPDGSKPPEQKLKGYIIHGSTGCTCCRSENFMCGIYDSADAAMAQAKYYHETKRLASQYASNGIYYVYEMEYETLSDGRVIFCNRVFDDRHIYESGEEINSISFGKFIDKVG